MRVANGCARAHVFPAAVLAHLPLLAHLRDTGSHQLGKHPDRTRVGGSRSQPADSGSGRAGVAGLRPAFAIGFVAPSGSESATLEVHSSAPRVRCSRRAGRTLALTVIGVSARAESRAAAVQLLRLLAPLAAPIKLRLPLPLPLVLAPPALVQLAPACAPRRQPALAVRSACRGRQQLAIAVDQSGRALSMPWVSTCGVTLTCTVTSCTCTACSS